METYNTEAIYKTPLFEGFESKELAGIADEFPFVFKTYGKGEIIIEQGGKVKNIGVVTVGRTTCSKYHYDGTEQLLQIMENGDFIGLEAVTSSFLTSPYMIISDTICVVAFFPYIKFLNSANVDRSMKIRILMNAINVMADDNIRKMYKIDVLSKRTLRERVITYLSIISEKRNTRTIDIGMTQAQFANYMCVNRSVLSNELNKMKRDGIINFKGSVYTILSESL